MSHTQGLIVNVSSIGGLKYLFNVAYGIGGQANTKEIMTLDKFSGKAGCDRMAADCGFELKKRGVAMVSLWPGAVKTEYVQVEVCQILNI